MTRSRHHGFTLVELLVVIAIISILISLLLPALRSARAVAQSAMCLSNQRQHTFALYQYLNDWNQWFPHSYEYFAWQNIGRLGRAWREVMSEYFGITSSWEVAGVGTFTGHLLTDDPNGFEIWNDPGRPPYLTGARWGSHHYGANGQAYLMTDSRVTRGRYDNVESVAVAAKTMWNKCHESAGGQLWGNWPSNFVHMGGTNYAFIDGHAQTFAGQSLMDYWLATGGSPYPPQPPTEYGFYTYTYPPGLEATPSLAQCWAVPWNRDGPFAVSQIQGWYPVR